MSLITPLKLDKGKIVEFKYTDLINPKHLTHITDLINGKADLPTGTPDGTKFLRDDNTWQTVTGTGGSSNGYNPQGW